MRLCRFDEGRLGLVEGDVVRDVTAALDVLPACRYPLPRHDVLIAHLPEIQARIEAVAAAAPVYRLDAITLRSPVANPGKIIAAPVNYQTHLDEVRGDAQLHQGNPAHTVTIHSAGVFLKASSSIAGPGDGVVICKPERRTDHEVELACVIGKGEAGDRRRSAVVCGRLRDRARHHDSGQRGPEPAQVAGQLQRARALAGDGRRAPTLGRSISSSVNGELRQRSNTRNLILGVRQLIELASSFYTLQPGDIIFTGTPDGSRADRGRRHNSRDDRRHRHDGGPIRGN